MSVCLLLQTNRRINKPCKNSKINLGFAINFMNFPKYSLFRVYLNIQAIILVISLQSIYMHYLYPFFSLERQGKIFVTIASILMIIIGILYIAYAGRNLNLYNRRQDYFILIEAALIFKDPLVGYYLFFGIQAIIVFLYNIIENWKQYRLADQSEPKWWITYWLMFLQSCFTMAAGVGACGSRNAYAPLISWMEFKQSFHGQNEDFYNYLQAWVNLYRFLLAIIVITFVIGIPLMIMLVYGLVQKLRAYRADVVKEGMHRNPELQLPAQNKPSVTKL